MKKLFETLEYYTLNILGTCLLLPFDFVYTIWYARKHKWSCKKWFCAIMIEGRNCGKKHKKCLFD